MSDDLKKLLEGNVLGDETKKALTEAWDKKLDEARETISADLREEFASKYEHDKSIVIEATEKMVKEALKEEFDELMADKKAIKEMKLKLKENLSVLSTKAHSFLKESLIKEMRELHEDRVNVTKGLGKFQNFAMKQLREEIEEYRTDKKALMKERVEFNQKKEKEIKEAKKQFVEKATKISEKVIRESLVAELTQLRQDLKESKENRFGRKLFESFAVEFMNSHYNEKSDVRKISKVLESVKKQNAVLAESLKTKDEAILEAKKEANHQKSLKERAEVMHGLLSKLGTEQKKTMKTLLESTSTEKLKENFQRYLPMVLESNGKKVLTERKSTSAVREYDGNHQKTEDDETVVQLRRLIGQNI